MRAGPDLTQSQNPPEVGATIFRNRGPLSGLNECGPRSLPSPIDEVGPNIITAIHSLWVGRDYEFSWIVAVGSQSLVL